MIAEIVNLSAASADNQPSSPRKRSTTNQEIAIAIDGELHRLRIPFLGWAPKPSVDSTRKVRTGVVLIGRYRERSLAYVPLGNRHVEELLGVGWEGTARQLNMSGFAGWDTLEFTLDRLDVLPVTYCGTVVGGVVYADILLERLKQIEE